LKKYGVENMITINGIETTDSNSFFVYENVDEPNSEIAFNGKGALNFPSRGWTT